MLTVSGVGVSTKAAFTARRSRSATRRASCFGGLGQHQRELLAAQPRGQVDAAGEPGHLGGEALQHLVAARVPEVGRSPA